MQDKESVNEKSALNESSKESNGSYLQVFKGISAAFGFVIASVVSLTTVQMLEKRVPDFELNTFRCGIPLLLYCLADVIFIK